MAHLTVDFPVFGFSAHLTARPSSSFLGRSFTYTLSQTGLTVSVSSPVAASRDLPYSAASCPLSFPQLLSLPEALDLSAEVWVSGHPEFSRYEPSPPLLSVFPDYVDDPTFQNLASFLRRALLGAWHVSLATRAPPSPQLTPTVIARPSRCLLVVCAPDGLQHVSHVFIHSAHGHRTDYSLVFENPLPDHSRVWRFSYSLHSPQLLASGVVPAHRSPSSLLHAAHFVAPFDAYAFDV